jgi:Smg protein
MNHSVLDVLMYLLETYSEEEQEPHADNNILRAELLRAGFGAPEVDRALIWLEDLHSDPGHPLPEAPGLGSVRLFATEETARLDMAARGYLAYLEQVGILSPLHRELVIDRLMALGSGEIDVEQVRWVTLMVLFSRQDTDHACAHLEALDFGEGPALLN